LSSVRDVAWVKHERVREIQGVDDLVEHLSPGSLIFRQFARKNTHFPCFPVYRKFTLLAVIHDAASRLERLDFTDILGCLGAVAVTLQQLHIPKPSSKESK
jgi:hypothetical protein